MQLFHIYFINLHTSLLSSFTKNKDRLNVFTVVNVAKPHIFQIFGSVV